MSAIFAIIKNLISNTNEAEEIGIHACGINWKNVLFIDPFMVDQFDWKFMEWLQSVAGFDIAISTAQDGRCILQKLEIKIILDISSLTFHSFKSSESKL